MTPLMQHYLYSESELLNHECFSSLMAFQLRENYVCYCIIVIPLWSSEKYLVGILIYLNVCIMYVLCLPFGNITSGCAASVVEEKYWKKRIAKYDWG